MEHFFKINIYKIGYTRLFFDDNRGLGQISQSEFPQIYSQIYNRLQTVVNGKKINWTISVFKKDSNILWGYGAWLPEITDEKNRKGLEFIHIKETNPNNLFVEIQTFLKLLYSSDSSSLVSILEKVAKTPDLASLFLKDMKNIFDKITPDENLGRESFLAKIEKYSKIEHDIVGSSSMAWLTLAFQQCLYGGDSWEIYDYVDSISNKISTMVNPVNGKSIKASELQRLLLSNLNKKNFELPQPNSTGSNLNIIEELKIIKKYNFENSFL